ncbi:SDR family NAD(P)-dependent oxidoreductase [candidate division KSB1 bacterium]
MNINLQNKNVLITGASRGIGKAIAISFAEAGANVIIHYNNNESYANNTLNSLKSNNHTIVKADLKDPIAIENLVKEVSSKYKTIDVLINNAGIYEEKPFLEMDYDEWQENWFRTLNTNLQGVANLSFLVAKSMKEQGEGKIINISSRGAFRGEPNAPAYGASKAGLNSLSQSMAKALAPYNIFVYVIAPGYVNTDMVKDIMTGPNAQSFIDQSPLKRIAEPNEIAKTAVFLASENTDYLTGCIIDINGASYLRS